MFARNYIVSLSIPFFIGAAGALDLDVNSADSIKSTAKTLASGIVKAYSNYLNKPGSVPGLIALNEEYFWWEFGTVWNGLVEYSHLTGDSSNDDLVSKALQFQVSEDQNFMPPNQTKTLGNEDQSTWALAALTAAEVGFPKPATGEWVDLAKNVFNDQAQRWDDKSCGGGLRWQIFTFNNGYSYKNSFSNGNFFLLAARLAQLTGNTTYSDWADKTFKWTQDVGFISKSYQVFDGADATTNCKSVNHIQWTYASAIFAEGAAVMYNLTKGDSKWKDAVTGFANASSVFLDKQSSILTEVACENNGKCDVDQRAFKGISSRSWARAALSAPFVADSFQKVIKASAKGAASNCGGTGADTKCSLKWTSGNIDAKSLQEGGLGEVFGAMEVVQALLYPQSSTGITASSGNGNSTSSATNNSTLSGTGSPTGSAGSAQPTGAASTREVAWGVMALAGAFAMLLL